jgi:hypothetical protein
MALAGTWHTMSRDGAGVAALCLSAWAQRFPLARPVCRMGLVTAGARSCRLARWTGGARQVHRSTIKGPRPSVGAFAREVQRG